MAKQLTGQNIVNPDAPHRPQTEARGSTENLASAVIAASKRGPPPVHLWNPPFCGDIDMRIARDGTWFYLGTPIGRAPLVKLFSSILRREGDAYFLVTPVEKVRITVEDAPFLAVAVEASGSGADQVLTFTTLTDDRAVAGPLHPIRVEIDAATGAPAPYVLIRADLWALIDRKTFYRLADLGRDAPHAGENWFGVWSGGAFFPVQRSAEIG